MYLNYFLRPDQLHIETIAGSYNLLLVGLSYVIATAASYVALMLATRMRVAEYGGRRTVLQVAGAATLGGGIWSMHFIGMLAFRMPMKVDYDVALTLLSLLIVISVSTYAFYLLRRPALSMTRLLGSGVLVGLGIAAMHYTGMAAMRMEAMIRYEIGIFSLSIMIAIIVATVALWLLYYLELTNSRRMQILQVGTAAVMGVAVVGMHYTAMFGTVFLKTSNIVDSGTTILHTQTLPLIIVALNILLLSLATVIAFHQEVTERRRAEMELRKHRDHLEELVEEKTRKIVDDNNYLDNILTSMNEALAVTRLDGTIRTSNRALNSLLKYDGDALIGKNIGTLFAIGNRPILPPSTGGNLQTIETILLASDGQEIPALFSASSLGQQDNGQQGIVCVAQDITQRKKMERALIRSNQQMQEDLRNAAEFQRSVLPDITSPSYMDIAVKYMPLTQVSGDIYDISSNREGELCVFLGDATGHGVAAALMTMMVQIGLDSVNHNQPADKIVDQLNSLLATHETGKFMTGIYFRISANGCIRAANAGHSPVIILPHGGTDCVQLKNGGLPLGILREGPVAYREEIWELNQGDKIFIYTDGVTEWKNEGDEEFGQDRLVQLLCKHRDSDVDVILDRLIDSIGEFSDGCNSEDDLTTLGFQYRG